MLVTLDNGSGKKEIQLEKAIEFLRTVHGKGRLTYQVRALDGELIVLAFRKRKGSLQIVYKNKNISRLIEEEN